MFVFLRKSFNEGIEDYRFKYEAIVKLKDYAKSETQVLLNYGVSNEEILRVVENNFDNYNTRKGYKEQDSVYVDNLFQNLKKQYHLKVLEEVIKIKVSKFREEQEKLIQLWKKCTRYSIMKDTEKRGGMKDV